MAVRDQVRALAEGGDPLPGPLSMPEERLSPFFLAGAAGHLFAIHHAPRPRDRGWTVLLLPPFAEEMNRSRRMATLQAHALAEVGVGTLVLDLYGTGDSHGEFGDARWEIWLQDVGVALSWLAARGRRIALCGLRLGAVLAAATAATDARVERLILWQPVVKGMVMLNQFLRLRMASELGETAPARDTTRELRALLARGQSVDVGGYEIAPELARAIDRLDLSTVPLRPALPVFWFELTREKGRSLSPASERVLSAWRSCDAGVTAETIVGEPFWSTLYTSVAPALIRATTRLFDDGSS